eukprot:TRINITY_DN2513_c0_g1_i2.p1 TRINITY_DN2513_c0_g1~~TRINITY_DN2513_c0_g1_i2.p1  ORF type:complete len:101 (-),score=24.24 TRINITY_DN2513_c0_g1_i2:257-559(-)
MSHTILLIQYTGSKGTRTFMDYDTVANALDAVCQLYEGKLKSQHPGQHSYSYDVNDLFRYVDSLGDISALVFDGRIQAYQPKSKEWVKEKLLAHLRRIAS